MRGFHYGSEEDIKGRIYDKQLFVRLISFLKPYLYQVILSFLLLLLIACAELALPYITKQAVDDVIAVNRNLIIFSSTGEAAEFMDINKKVNFNIFEYQDNTFLIFPNNKMNYIHRNDLDKFTSDDRLHRKIIFLDNKDSIRDLLENQGFWELAENRIAVPSAYLEDLQKKGVLDKVQLKVLRAKDARKLLRYGIIFVAIVFFQFIFTYFQIYSINYAAQHAMYDLRRKVFGHLEKMPLSFFDKNPIGRLVTRITNDVRTLDEMLSAGLIKLIQDLLIMLGILVMMLILNWRLALVTFTVMPVLFILLRTFKNKIRVAYRIVRKRVAAINAALSEDISGVKIIQLFNQYNRKRREFAKINREYYQASIRQMKIYASFRPFIHSMRRIAIAIILWYGLGQVMKNSISLGIFIAFLSYMDRFFEPIDHLSEKFNILQAAMAGSERIFDLMGKPIENYLEKDSPMNRLQGGIEFQNVWLRYNEHDGDILKDISFKVKPGEKIALVGHTGSGKTSIISLISGLYPFQKGRILIDGKELHDYTLEDLRGNVGIVQQDVFLFSGTIRDNIALNNVDFTDEDMLRVAEYVNVHDFIETLPGKYQEPVMERGATFSVGQRQLIAFARVLAYNPAIFVLDEATSNIDTETEILIQDALKKLMEDRTSIIIAHRLSTIQHVDRIIVIHKGEIKEKGNHQELLARKGLYYDLYRLQYT